MIEKICPSGTSIVNRSTAVKPPNRTVKFLQINILLIPFRFLFDQLLKRLIMRTFFLEKFLQRDQALRAKEDDENHSRANDEVGHPDELAGKVGN